MIDEHQPLCGDTGDSPTSPTKSRLRLISGRSTYSHPPLNLERWLLPLDLSSEMPQLSGPDVLPLNVEHDRLSQIQSQFQFYNDTGIDAGNRSRLHKWGHSAYSAVLGAWQWVMDWLTGYRLLRVPLMNWGVIIAYALFLARLTMRFKTLYAAHALRTMMTTNLLLYGLADTLAQTLESAIAFHPEPEENVGLFYVKYILEKGRPMKVILDEEDDDLVELGLESDYGSDDLGHDNDASPAPSSNEPKIFSFRRQVLFSLWGIIISFFQSPWYAFLNGIYNEHNQFLTALKRVLADQLCYSPVSLACFLTYMTIVMERGDRDAVGEMLKTRYIQTLAVNYLVWPASQFVNFLIVPSPLQIPFSSTVGVFWNAYLSLKNASRRR